MSYTSMFKIDATETVEVETFRNSHGSATRVWDALSEKYLGRKRPRSDDSRLWQLREDPRLLRCEKIVLLFTFDRMICEPNRARELAAALREFNQAHPRAEGYVNHLPDIAAALERHADDAGAKGFLFIQTSVADDVWHIKDRCPDSYHDHDDADQPWCDTCSKSRECRDWYRMFRWDRDKDRTEEYFWLFSSLEEGR